jgi:glycosyltransferase involved in cell wall biosynthesis
VNPKIISFLRRNRYHAIIVGGYDSWTMQVIFLYARVTRTPLILWSDSTLYEKRPCIVLCIKRIFLPILIKQCSSFIAAGTRSKEYLIHYGANADHVYIAPLTVDVDFFSDQVSALRNARPMIKGEIGIRSPLVILYVGRLIPEKGVTYLLKAYHNLVLSGLKAALIMVGEGPLEPELRKFCAENQLDDVHFVGFMQQAQLPRYYAVADIFVLPSLSEPWGVVVNEAMASSLPVIVTEAVGAVGDIVRDGVNGYVVPPADVEKLSNAMRKLLEDDQRRIEMGDRSRQIIQCWTYTQAVQGFLSAITDALY